MIFYSLAMQKRTLVSSSTSVDYKFHAWTKDSTKPITLWVEAKNHESARNAVMRENPYINRLMFIRTKRIN